MISEVIHPDTSLNDDWRTHPFAGTQIGTEQLTGNLAIVSQMPLRVYLSIGQGNMQARANFHDMQRRYHELLRQLHLRGTRHVLVIPPFTWRGCDQVR